MPVKAQGEDLAKRVGELVAKGYEDADIARKLSISVRTVLRHRKALGLGTATRTPDPTAEQILKGLETGLSLNQLAKFHHRSKDRLGEILVAAGHKVPKAPAKTRTMRSAMLATVREQEAKKGLPQRRAQA